MSARQRFRAWLSEGQAPAAEALAGRRPTPLQCGLWAALMAGFLALSLRGFRSIQIGATNDDAAYIILARSLAHSDRYGLIHNPDGPEATKFPFIYPLVLAPLAALFPDDLEALRLPSLLATLAAGTLLFWGWPWFSRARSHWWALGVTGLCLWSPVAVGHSAAVMSDPLFVLLCVAAWQLTERCARGRGGLGAAAGLGCVLCAAVFTRAVGVALLPCAGAALCLARGRQALRLLAAAGGAGLVLLVLLVSVTPVDSAALPRFFAMYGNELGASVRGAGFRDSEVKGLSPAQFWAVRLHRHVRDDLRGAVAPLGGGAGEAAFFDRLGLPSPMPLAAYALLVLSAVGFARWGAREGPSAAWLFAIGYSALLAVWNWRGPRLLYPILPQLYFSLLLGLEALGRLAAGQRRGPAGRGLAAAAAAALLAMFGAASMRPVDSLRHIGDLSARTAWLRENTPRTARVLTEHPLIDYLYGGRQTYGLPPRARSAAGVAALPALSRADYILVAPDVRWEESGGLRYSTPMRALAAYAAEMEAAGRIRLVYTSTDRWIRVYAAENQ